MYKSLLRLIVFIFFFSGCATPVLAPEESTTVKTAPSNLKEVIPEQKVITDTPDNKGMLQVTPTYNSVSSPTDSPGVSPTTIVQIIGSSTPIPQCSGNGQLETPGKDFGIPGTLFYQQTNDPGSLSGIYAVGGTPLKQEALSIGVDSGTHVFGVSPDGRWLAYSPVVKSQNTQTGLGNQSVSLIGRDGKRITHILDLTWLNSINEPGYQLEKFVWGYWINDHLIFTLVNSKIPGDELGVGRFYLAILDPFDGAWQIEVFDHLPVQTGNWGAAISPDLTHVLFDADGIRLIEIFDNSVRQLWQDEYSEFPSISAARWSPDGAWVVFANSRIMSPDPAHLFLISADGKTINEIQNPEVGSFFKNFYWSPNGRYFAYVSEIYSENAPDKDNLLVFDVEQGKFVLECPILQVDLPLAELTWSPSSDSIAISQIGGTIRVLDISTGSMVNLNIDGVIVGWSDKFLVNYPQ